MKRILFLFIVLMTYISTFAIEYKGVNYTTASWNDGKPHKNTDLGTATAISPATGTLGDVVIVDKVKTQIINGTGYVVKSIAANAFKDNETITSVTISSSVESIGSSAFANMRYLRYVVCEGSTPASLGSSVFLNCKSTLAIVVPENAVDAYKNADGWKDLNIVTQIPVIENAIEFADSRVKIICLKNWDTNHDGELTLEEAAAVTNIGSIFSKSEITSFDELQYFTELEKIDESAFDRCGKLVSVTIPNSVTSIGKTAFNQCTSLTSIEIPNSVTSIEYCAFAYCSALASITIPCTATYVEGNILEGCSSIESIISLARGVSYTNLNTSAVVYTYASEVENIKKSFSGTVVPFKDGYTIEPQSSYVRGVDFKIKALQDQPDDCVLLKVVVDGKDVQPDSDGFYFANGLQSNEQYTIQAYYNFTEEINGNRIQLEGVAVNTMMTKMGILSADPTTTQTTITLSNISASVDKSAVLKKKGFIFNDKEYATGKKISGLEPGVDYFFTLFVDYADGERVTINLEVTTKGLNPTLTVAQNSPTAMRFIGSYDKGDAQVVATYMKINGNTIDGNEGYCSTEPNDNITIYYYVKIKSGREYYTNKSYTTPSVELTTLPAKAVNPGEVIVAARTNLADEETRIGFEWRKHTAPDDLPSSSGEGRIYDGTMEAKIKNLSTSNYYRFRPYFQNSKGERTYGEWIAFDPSDFSYCEPTVHTYASVQMGQEYVTLTGYVLNGSDAVIEQGFEYWVKGSTGVPSFFGVPANVMVVKASGQRMTATLDNLQAGVTYSFRAYAKTNNGTTYGEEQTFTLPTTNDIVSISNESASNVPENILTGIYTMMGVKVSDDESTLRSLPSGIYIVNGRKVVVK